MCDELWKCLFTKQVMWLGTKSKKKRRDSETCGMGGFNSTNRPVWEEQKITYEEDGSLLHFEFNSLSQSLLWSLLMSSNCLVTISPKISKSSASLRSHIMHVKWTVVSKSQDVMTYEERLGFIRIILYSTANHCIIKCINIRWGSVFIS